MENVRLDQGGDVMSLRKEAERLRLPRAVGPLLRRPKSWGGGWIEGHELDLQRVLEPKGLDMKDCLQPSGSHLGTTPPYNPPPPRPDTSQGLETLLVVTPWGKGAPGAWRVGAGDAAQHPMVHRTAIWLPVLAVPELGSLLWTMQFWSSHCGAMGLVASWEH